MYSAPLKVDGTPESIEKDFSTASRDITRQITRGGKNEFKFFIKGIEFNLSKNDALILDAKSEPNKENTVKVQLKRKSSSQHSEIDKEIDVKINHNPNNSIDNWTQFFEELLKKPEFELDQEEQQNIINMLKGYWQQRFGMKFCEVLTFNELGEPLRKNDQSAKTYKPSIPYLVFSHGSPKDEPVDISVDADKNATLETKFPFKTYMKPSPIFGKFENKFPLNENDKNKGLVTYSEGFGYYFPHLKIYEKTKLTANSEEISYQKSDASSLSPFLLKYFDNKEEFLKLLQIDRISNKAVKALAPEIQKMEADNKKDRPNDEVIAKDLIKEIRLFAGLSILDYQAKLTKRVAKDKSLSKEQKSLLFKRINSHTQFMLKHLRNLNHPKHVADFLQKVTNRMKSVCHNDKASVNYDNVLEKNISKLEGLSSEYIEKSNNPKYSEENRKLYKEKAESLSSLAEELKEERNTFRKQFLSIDQNKRKSLEDIEKYIKGSMKKLDEKMNDISDKLNTHRVRNYVTDTIFRGASRGVGNALKWIKKKCSSPSTTIENEISLSDDKDSYFNNTSGYNEIKKIADSIVKEKRVLINSYKYSKNPSKFIANRKAALESSQSSNQLIATAALRL